MLNYFANVESAFKYILKYGDNEQFKQLIKMVDNDRVFKYMLEYANEKQFTDYLKTNPRNNYIFSKDGDDLLYSAPNEEIRYELPYKNETIEEYIDNYLSTKIHYCGIEFTSVKQGVEWLIENNKRLSIGEFVMDFIEFM